MANEQMREMWTAGAIGWVEHRDLFDAELEGFSDALLEAVPAASGGRVLDIGCGTGNLSARYAAGGAKVLGADISPVMVEAARSLVPDATFLLADAQTDDLTSHGPFDAVVSRFGVMFFDDPVAAFTNIRRAVAPAGRLGFVCWRGLDENRMFTLGNRALARRLDPPARPPAHGVPGPLAFAEPGVAAEVLEQSGWTDVRAGALDVICDYSRADSDGVEERLTMVLNTTGGRAARAQLEPRLGPEGWGEVLDEVRDEIRAERVDGRVAFPGAVWLVTATAPT